MRAPEQVRTACLYPRHIPIRVLVPGAWLLELQQHVPKSVNLHGIDLSADQFPKDNVPDNLHFRVASIVDLPQEWTGQFDLINQRMLFAGLLAKDWPVALQNYLRILKPGGRVQLADIAPSSSQYKAGPHSLRFGELIEKMFRKAGLFFDAAERLPKMVEEAGFVNVRAEQKFGPVGEVRGNDGLMGKISNAGGMKAMRAGLLKFGLIEDEEAAEELFKGTQEDWENSGGFDMAYIIVTAEKP